MLSRLQILIAACLYYSGLLKLIYCWSGHSGQYLVILNYHRAAGGNLRRHLLYLSRHFRILHLETALEELYTPRKGRLQIGDRRLPLVLTFDDGYYDSSVDAFSLACELHIPITIFLIPGYVGGGNSFWWLDRLVRFAQVDEAMFEGYTYRLDQQEERKALVQAIDARFSHIESEAEREEFLVSVHKVLAVPSSKVFKEEPVPLLNWAQVQEMEESKWVSFGSHTMYHPILANLTDPCEVKREVVESREMLEQRLGHPIRVFAYPYGKLEHIGNKGLIAVRQGEYDWAVTTMPGFNTSRSNPYLLRRIYADVSQHWLIIAMKMAGLGSILSLLRRIASHLHRQHTKVPIGVRCLIDSGRLENRK